MKNKRGITLISLVITIIVLLILAGITISGIVGNDGILNQSQNAKTKTDLSKEQELRDLTMGEAMTNLELTWYKDGENKVPIPAGFAVSQVEGENTVEDGLVIIDSEGNEFVWIPCGTKQADGTYSTTEYDSAKNYVTTKWSGQISYYTDRTWTNPNETIAKNSISKYGGFYVARFEAGVSSDAPFHISHTSGDSYVGVNNKNEVSITEGSINARGANTETDRIKDLKPVSKRGVQAWNFISQTNAVTVSKNMYENNNTINSCLISSNDWNYICQSIFIDKFKLDVIDSKKYGNYKDNTTTDYTSLDCLCAKHTSNNGSWEYATQYEKESITKDSRSGNYRLELATGASDDFKVYNIYDMAGNVREWTSETSNGWGVLRSGDFSTDVGESVVRANGGHGSSYCNVNVGFRPVLYLKDN